MKESIRLFRLEKEARYEQRIQKWITQHKNKKRVIKNSDGECLSVHMKSDPTKEQLEDRDGDAFSAQLAYAVDSGLGRMKDSKKLHLELQKIKNEETDGSQLSQEFKNLAKEIENENSPKNLQRIVESFKKKD